MSDIKEIPLSFSLSLMQTLKTTPPPPKWQPQPLDLLEVPKADHLSAQSLHLADFIKQASISISLIPRERHVWGFYDYITITKYTKRDS
jgi:hypothetical protein